jgi:hypothetical protein
MRRALAIIVLGVWLLALTPSQSAAAGDCTPPGVEVITKSRLGLVYKRDDSLFYACLRTTGRRFGLGSGDIDGGLDRFVLAGPFVAYTDTICSRSEYDGCLSSLVVRDLRTTRVTGKYSGGIPVDFVLRRTGAFGLIAQPSPGQLRVVKADRLGRRLLDEGSDIDRASLSLLGATLSWVRGGVRKTARLR